MTYKHSLNAFATVSISAAHGLASVCQLATRYRKIDGSDISVGRKLLKLRHTKKVKTATNLWFQAARGTWCRQLRWMPKIMRFSGTIFAPCPGIQDRGLPDGKVKNASLNLRGIVALQTIASLLPPRAPQQQLRLAVCRQRCQTAK